MFTGGTIWVLTHGLPAISVMATCEAFGGMQDLKPSPHLSVEVRDPENEHQSTGGV